MLTFEERIHLANVLHEVDELAPEHFQSVVLDLKSMGARLSDTQAHKQN